MKAFRHLNHCVKARRIRRDAASASAPPPPFFPSVGGAAAPPPGDLLMMTRARCARLVIQVSAGRQPRLLVTRSRWASPAASPPGDLLAMGALRRPAFW